LLSRPTVELANTFKRATQETQKRIVRLDLASAFVILIYTAYCSNETIMACYTRPYTVVYLFKKECVLCLVYLTGIRYTPYPTPTLLMQPAAMPHGPDSSHPPTAYSQSPNIKLSTIED
jgi:hypothetical protein